MSQARLLLPDKISAGEVVTVRLLIQHTMETGYRQDVNGRLIARNVIRLVRCELAGREVFRAEPSSGLSANPLFEFSVRAHQSAEWLVQWEDEQGLKAELRQTMSVT